jgi:hypothetical protein
MDPRTTGKADNSRKACAELHRLHLGPQVLTVLLVRHESVRWSAPWRAYADGCRQPILADEVQTFKALITIHKVLQEGHPIVLKEAQGNIGWLESLRRGVVNGEGVRGYNKLIEEYISFLRAKLNFHKQHPEFNGTSYI